MNYTTTIYNGICIQTGGKTEEAILNVDLIGLFDEIKVKDHRTNNQHLSSYFLRRNEDFKSKSLRSDKFPHSLRMTMADRGLDLFSKNGSAIILIYEDGGSEKSHEVEVYYHKEESRPYVIPLLIKLGNKFFGPRDKDSYFLRWDRIIGQNRPTASISVDLKKELDGIYARLNEVDLSQRSSYGIPCCPNHLYYRRGNFSTKRVDVTKYSNSKYTMFVHRMVSQSYVGAITHSTYDSMFDQHFNSLWAHNIDEVAVIYTGSGDDVDKPVLLLLSQSGKQSSEPSTTYGFYFLDAEAKRGDTFDQYAFKAIKGGCKLMAKLTGQAEGVNVGDDCLRVHTQSLRDTWVDITSEKMALQPSPDKEEDTLDCQVPVDSDLGMATCSINGDQASGRLDTCSADPGSGQSVGRNGQVEQRGGVTDARGIDGGPGTPVYKGHPDLKLYTLDNNVARANDVTKFEVSTGTQTFIYKFKQGAQCIEVRFRNKTLWVHDANAHGHNYPCEVSYYVGFDRLYVYMNDTWVYSYSFKIVSWTLYKADLKGRPAKLTPPPADRKITYASEPADPVSNSDLPRGTLVTDHPDITITSRKSPGDVKVDNKSDYRVFEHEDTLTFMFENGTKCLKVHYKGVEVWKHAIAEHGTKYPKFVLFDRGANRLEVIFNSEWYYGFLLNPGGKWTLFDKKVVMKPGELQDLFKRVFNVVLTLSPSLLSYFSGMSIRTIKICMWFTAGVSPGLKTLIDKLYDSDMYRETLPAIIANPDQLPKLLDMVKGTSLAVDEAKLNTLIANPELLLHLLKEIKAVGFNVDELVKTLLLDPVKLNTILVKMKGLGYAWNETEIKKLAQNAELLSYLKVPASAVSALATAGEAGASANLGSGAGEDEDGPLQRADEFIQNHKSELSAAGGGVVGVAGLSTVGAVVYNKAVLGTAGASAAAALF